MKHSTNAKHMFVNIKYYDTLSKRNYKFMSKKKTFRCAELLCHSSKQRNQVKFPS